MHFLCLLYIAVTLGLYPETTVFWDEINAVHQQNVAATSRLRVRWEFTQRDTQMRSKYYLQEAESQDRQSQDTTLSPELRRQFRISAGYIRKAEFPFSDRKKVIRHDFWTDGRNFQIRKEPISTKQLVGHFPNSQATPDLLVKDFERILIISFGDETKQLFRVWSGETDNGRHSGYIAKTHPVDVLRYPPFGRVDRHWPGRELAIDKFWTEDATSSEVLGEVEFEKRKCVVVRRTWPPLKLSPDDRDGSGMTAWIDLARGAIPLRVERYRFSKVHKSINAFSDVTPSTLKRPPFPWLVSRQIYIEQVTPDCFYPVSGIEQQLGLANVPRDASSPKEFVPHTIYEWKTIKVDTAQDMTKANFALQFPNSTVFFNEPTNDIRVTTDASGTAELLVQGARRLIAPPTWSAAIVQFGAIVACLTAVVWLIRNRFVRSS